MERYRSGHNEAVLKTVCPQGRVGSNPTLSVIIARSHIDTVQFFSGKCSRENKRTNTILCVRSAWRSTQEAEGAPLERVQVVNSGARVQIPPSPLAQKNIKKIKKVVDKHLNT